MATKLHKPLNPISSEDGEDEHGGHYKVRYIAQNVLEWHEYLSKPTEEQVRYCSPVFDLEDLGRIARSLKCLQPNFQILDCFYGGKVLKIKYFPKV